jgi:NAD(P)H-dependent flavin oxidoreductase YrpB (nitropropane dioxygenase family)
MDGRDLAAALMLGAEGVQMGTAFLPRPESGIHPKYKEAVLAAQSEETSLTRAFSGKRLAASATALRRRWISKRSPPTPGRTPSPKISERQPRKRTASGFCPSGLARRPASGSNTGGGGRREHGKRSSTKAVGYRPSAILTIRRPLTTTAR